jgi:hypothetical protein
MNFVTDGATTALWLVHFERSLFRPILDLTGFRVNIAEVRNMIYKYYLNNK